VEQIRDKPGVGGILSLLPLTSQPPLIFSQKDVGFECCTRYPEIMLQITKRTSIPLNEIELSAVRSQGAGGQNVNKVATAIHLRFDIQASSLSPLFKERLLKLGDSRITKDGIVVIKAQQYRTQEQNKEDALNRLQDLVKSVTVTPKKRKPTKPSRSAKNKRIDRKKKRGQKKALRGNVRQ
jgi:ribosome-associated protein